MKQQLNQLLTKEMDRKDFLKYTGSIILTVIGVTGLMRTVLQHQSFQSKSHGYGSSPYGGSNKR